MCVRARACVRVHVSGRTRIHTALTSKPHRFRRLAGVRLSECVQREHRCVDHRVSDKHGIRMRRPGRAQTPQTRSVGIAVRYMPECVRRCINYVFVLVR